MGLSLYNYKIIQLIVCDGALYLADPCLQTWTMVAGGGCMCGKALPAHGLGYSYIYINAFKVTRCFVLAGHIS